MYLHITRPEHKGLSTSNSKADEVNLHINLCTKRVLPFRVLITIKLSQNTEAILTLYVLVNDWCRQVV